jgi:hypothetical protein
MGVSKKFYPHALILDASGTPVVITQLSDFGHSKNLTELHEKSAGDFELLFAGSQMEDPVFSLRTQQIETFLGAMADNAATSADFSAKNVDAWWRAGKAFNARYTTTDESHLRGRMESNAMVVVDSIRAEGLAELTARVIPVSTDGTSPVVYTTGLALAGTEQAAEHFKNGPIKINGTLRPTQGWTYELAIELEKIAADGEGFYSYVGIKDIKRQLRFQTTDAELLSTYGGNGAAVTAATWFLRKYKDKSHAYATTDEEHIKFAATSGHLVMTELSGSDAIAQGVLTLTRPSAGTAPVAVTFDQAIS